MGYKTKEGYRVFPLSDNGLHVDHGWDTPNPILIGMTYRGKKCLGTGVWDSVTGEELTFKKYNRDDWTLVL